MVPRLTKEADPLVEYTEPINSRIFRKADRLNKEKQHLFEELRQKYMSLGFLVLHFIVPKFTGGGFLCIVSL
jgi:hypothetical protein